MNKPVDIIILRSEQGLCPICKSKVPEEFTVVDYKDQEIKTNYYI